MKKTLDEQIQEVNSQKGLSYEDWRQKDNAGWYMSHEKEENRFERYLNYLRENNFDYDQLNSTTRKKKNAIEEDQKRFFKEKRLKDRISDLQYQEFQKKFHHKDKDDFEL